MNKAYAWFRIMRPPIVFIAVFGSIAGSLNFIDAETNIYAFAIAMFAWGVLWAGIMVHNDYTDLESDKLNRPNKPVPCGAITEMQAKWGGYGMMAGGTLAIFLVYIPVDIGYAISSGFWAFTLFAVGYVYNNWGKNWGVWGHAQVAWGVAIIPFFGGAVIDPVNGAIALAPLFVAIFISEIGREIVVCTGDYFGDVKQGWKTIPVRLGRKKAMLSVLVFYVFFIPFYHLPFTGLWGYPKFFGPVYFWGYTIFIVALYLMWWGTWKALRRGQKVRPDIPEDSPRRRNSKGEKRTWKAFELYARTGTRLFIIFSEFVLLAEAFF